MPRKIQRKKNEGDIWFSKKARFSETLISVNLCAISRSAGNVKST
jgi:hypothetical protein